MSNEREQLIARLRRFAVVLEARGETYDAETCEQAIASLSAPVAERGQPFALYAAPPVEQKAADNIHTCSYYCTRPACIRAQRDELRDKMEAQQKAEPVAWQPVPLRACIKPTHEAADAFWKYWRENGETHKHGYYESTWGAINAALACGYAAPPLDAEGIRLLREVLNNLLDTGWNNKLFDEIYAYLAKYPGA